MANTKEVRKQIASIKSTQKITSAMEMVAASKMKKTQDTMLEGRPYSLKIKDVGGIKKSISTLLKGIFE